MIVQTMLNTDVENTTMVIKSKLLALKEEGGYVTFVFVDLNIDRYIMCTKLPNWDCPVIEIGDIGFLQYKDVIGGESEWYNRNTGSNFKYSYDNTYFVNFVPCVDKPKPQHINEYI